MNLSRGLLRRASIVSGALLQLLLARAASAHVTPPAAKTALTAPWPGQSPEAHDVVVPLVVVVDEHGNVSDAHVEVSVAKDLDDAALRAARQFTFAPALDDGVAVAARVRIAVRFVGQPTQDVSEAEPEVASAPAATITLRASARQSDATPARQGDAASAPEVAQETDVVVQGRSLARTASEVQIDAPLIQAAPHRTAAELLQLVPGVYTAQHGGEGDAYQIFYRGFDAVHGQDLELWAGGAPVNDVSNVHGQGYADLNFLMPEVVRSIHASPGNYEPQQGDFAVAGSLRFDLGYGEPGLTVKATLGQFDTRRYFLAYRPTSAPESDFIAFETYATDGFGPSRSARRSSVVAQSVLDLGHGVNARLLGTAYAAHYDSAGVLRLSDVESGAVGRFATYDPKQGGNASRASFVLDVSGESEQGTWSLAPYLVLHSLRLRQNFTGFLPDSVHNDASSADGNSEQQLNDATSLGLRSAYRHNIHWFSDFDDLEAGVSARSDWIDQSQRRLSVLSDQVTLAEVDAVVRASDLAGYLDFDLRPLHGLALRGGLRLDGLSYAAEDNGLAAAGEARSAQGAHLGKKASASYSLARGLTALLSYGEGFRSPQARSLAGGQTTPFAEVRSYEAGVRYQSRQVNASLAGFRTSLSEDLAFDQATARNEVTPGTARTGLSLDFIATPVPWFLSATSFTYTRAEFQESGHGFVAGDLLPYAPQAVLRSDLSIGSALGSLWRREVRGRFGFANTFMAGRPLPYGEFGHDVFLVDARVSVRMQELELSLDAFNVLDADWYEGEFVYASNFAPGAAASLVPERHVTVGAPRTLWFSLALYL